MNAALTNPIAPATPDTLRLAKRFFWKELRMQSGLAMGAGGIAVLVMLVHRFNSPPGAAHNGMAGIAFGAAALFCVAAAVTLFSVEREEGTTLFLQSLPDNRWATLLGKLASVLASTPLLFAVLIGIGILAAGGNSPAAPMLNLLFTTGLVVLLELFVWSLLASLLVPKPLLAACLGIAGASFSSFAAIAAAGGNIDLFQLGDSQALPARLLLCVAVGALDVWLGLNWLPRGEQRVRIKVQRKEKATPATRSSVGWLGSFGRLAWQTHRQSWKSALAALVIGGCLTLAWPLVLGMAMGMDHLVRETPRPAVLLGALFVPALMGALVFREDQRRRQHRFLSEHAAPPRRVWLARQTVWLGYLTLLYGGIVLTAAMTAASGWRQNLLFNSHWSSYDQRASKVYQVADFLQRDALAQLHDTTVAVLVGVGAAAFTAYAVGQFFSLTLRSEIFAGLLSLGASWLLAGWAMLVFYWRLSPVWAVAPIGLGALLATWLRAPAWLFERGGLRPWVLPAMALVAPLAFLSQAVPAARESQLSVRYWPNNLPNGEATLAGMAVNARAERSRGRHVADGYTLLDGFAMDSDALQEFIRLSKIDCRLPPSPLKKSDRSALVETLINNTPDYGKSGPRIDVLLACRRAKVQLHRGKPAYEIDWNPPQESDLDQEIAAWAAVDGRTSEEILAVRDQLRMIDWPANDPTDQTMNAYLESADEISGASPGTAKIDNLVKWTAYLLPSRIGQQRAERALNILALSEIDYLTACAIDANRTNPAQGREILDHAVRGNYISTAEVVATASAVGGLNVQQALANLDLVRNAESSAVGAWSFTNRWTLCSRVRMWLTQYSWRKAELVRLALLAYRADHGEYPARLDKLYPDYIATDDTLFDLLDPWNGLPFGYAPDGFEHPISTGMYSPLIAPRTPVLWGGGAQRAVPTESEEQFELDEEGKIVGVSRLHEDERDEMATGHTIETRTIIVSGGNGGRFWMPLPATEIAPPEDE